MSAIIDGYTVPDAVKATVLLDTEDGMSLLLGKLGEEDWFLRKNENTKRWELFEKPTEEDLLEIGVGLRAAQAEGLKAGFENSRPSNWH